MERGGEMLSQHQSVNMQRESRALPRLVAKLPKNNNKFREKHSFFRLWRLPGKVVILCHMYSNSQLKDSNLLPFCQSLCWEADHIFSSSLVYFLHRNIFERISAVKELSFFRQSLRIFIKHFVAKSTWTDMNERLNLVDGILGASDTTKL